LEVSGQLHSQAALPPGEEPPVPIGQEAGWAPEPVWTMWRRENSCAYRDSNFRRGRNLLVKIIMMNFIFHSSSVVFIIEFTNNLVYESKLLTFRIAEADYWRVRIFYLQIPLLLQLLQIFLTPFSHFAKKLNAVFVAPKFKKTLNNSALDIAYL
jgi:hypothetical protein